MPDEFREPINQSSHWPAPNLAEPTRELPVVRAADELPLVRRIWRWVYSDLKRGGEPWIND